MPNNTTTNADRVNPLLESVAPEHIRLFEASESSVLHELLQLEDEGHLYAVTDLIIGMIYGVRDLRASGYTLVVKLDADGVDYQATLLNKDGVVVSTWNGRAD